ncbi:CBS domain-containing protein [bacterium]|nr:CBS domain-containing protein [bacterium]
MDTELVQWLGLGISFLAAFFFSLFYLSLSAFSKISLSRFLENRKKSFRDEILDIYEELKISLGFLRVFFFIAFMVYFSLIFPESKFLPLWFFLISVGIYFLLLDILSRLLVAFGKKRILSFLLSSYRIPYLISKPLLFITKFKGVIPEQEEQHEPSKEEIQALVEKAKEEGIIEKKEVPLLRSVVEFGDTLVREIMTPRVEMVCIAKDSTIKKLRIRVIEEKHSRIPVYKDRIDNIEGIVIAKDLLEFSADKLNSASIQPLIRPVYFVPETMRVNELLKELQQRKQKLSIVVDEHGGVSGLVTMEDLVEEIVGEIEDEYDAEKKMFIKNAPYDYTVLGDAEVEELERLFGLELENSAYITVGGMITHYLGRLPEKGESVHIKGLNLEVLDVDQKRVKKLRIKKETEESEKRKT